MTRNCVILCLIFFAFTVNGSSLETLSNAWASQYGEVPIRKDYYGFYVDVDYSYLPSSSKDMTRMLLGLSNSETLLPVSCATFDPFVLSQHNYTVWSYYNKTVDYPSLSAEAYQIKTTAYMDYANWKLTNYGYAAGSCTSGTASAYATGRGGIIGLGNNDGSGNNFISSSTFSIYFDKNLMNGKLLFRYEPSLAASTSPVVFGTDYNWRYNFNSGKVQVGYYINYMYGKLVFDAHAKAIGFPQTTFQSIVADLKYIHGMTCSSDLTNPTCNYYGYLKNLPTIKLTLDNVNIELPPSVYVKNPSSDYQYGITLNLQALGTTLTGSNYVTNTFKDAIILDAQFMSYYYVVFERYRVKLYVQGTPSPKANGTELIVFIVVGLILVTSVCVCIFKKKKKLAEPSLPSSQDPSMNQPSYNQAPVQPNNGYVYPQNNYPAVHQNGQYAQQPAGYVQQPGYYPPPQQYQQPGYVNYGA